MQIALITDTHLMPLAPAFDINLAAARAFIAKHGFPATIHLGDITADGAVEPDHLDHAMAHFADWPGEICFLPGNHDIGDNPGDHDHPRVNRERMERFAAAFGPDRWVKRVGDWTLIGLNALLFGGGDALEAAQDAWLDMILPAIAGPVGLFLHKPLFRLDPADPDRHHRYVPVDPRGRLLGRLAGIDLRFVVAGHTHQSRKLHIDGIEHLWVPSTAFILPDAMQETIGEKKVGMIVLTLEDGREAAHRFDDVALPDMVAHNLVDQAHVYPHYTEALLAMPRHIS